MRLTTLLRLVLLVGVVMTSGVATVLAQGAQSPSQRPYRGLFGGGGANSDQSLDFNASVFGGYSDDVFSQGRPSPSRPASGFFYGASLGLDYARSTDWGYVGAGFSTGLRFYPDQDDLIGQQHRGYFTLSSQLGSRTTLAVSQAVSYSPRYRFYFLGDEALPPPPGLPGEPPGFDVAVEDDYAVSSQQALSYATGVSLSRRVSRRGTLSGSAAYRVVDFDAGDANDVTYWSAGVRYSHQLSQHLAARAGYGYRPSRYGGTGETDYAGHNIDVGVDYSRAFTLSRSTTFSFSTGSAILVRERTDLEDAQTRYGLLASAALHHSFARTWSTTVSYSRGITYVPGLAEPFWGDTMVATLGGLVSSRLQFSASAGYSHGKPGFSTTQQDYDTYSASAGLRAALTRNLALSAGYFFYHYSFDEGITLPPGVAQEMDRQGVRASLDFWLPLLR